jgi:hypothetical protein
MISPDAETKSTCYVPAWLCGTTTVARCCPGRFSGCALLSVKQSRLRLSAGRQQRTRRKPQLVAGFTATPVSFQHQPSRSCCSQAVRHSAGLLQGRRRASLAALPDSCSREQWSRTHICTAGGPMSQGATPPEAHSRACLWPLLAIVTWEHARETHACTDPQMQMPCRFPTKYTLSACKRLCSRAWQAGACCFTIVSNTAHICVDDLILSHTVVLFGSTTR